MPFSDKAVPNCPCTQHWRALLPTRRTVTTNSLSTHPYTQYLTGYPIYSYKQQLMDSFTQVPGRQKLLMKQRNFNSWSIFSRQELNNCFFIQFQKYEIAGYPWKSSWHNLSFLSKALSCKKIMWIGKMIKYRNCRIFNFSSCKCHQISNSIYCF